MHGNCSAVAYQKGDTKPPIWEMMASSDDRTKGNTTAKAVTTTSITKAAD